MGGRYGGDPTKRGKAPAWRVSVEVLAAIGREAKPAPKKAKDDLGRVRDGVPA